MGTRVLITGSGGMLGNAIYPYFKDRYQEVVATDKDVNAPWLKYLDVRDTDRVSLCFKEFKPNLVLHLAAETDLEFCEANQKITIDTNARATKNIAKLAFKFDSTLVYISTAGVFDGKKDGFYTEEDQPNPIMVYGQTKFDGENYVRENCKKYYVIRAGWMIGGGAGKDHKFVSLILDQILNGSKLIYAVSDRFGTPTYTHDFAMNLFKLLESKHYGTYHMVCEGSGARYDVAKEILRICGHRDIMLRAVGSDFFKARYWAPRPRSEMMVNANLRRLNLNFMRPWQEALTDYIHTEFSCAIAPSKQDYISDDSGVRRASMGQ